MSDVLDLDPEVVAILREVAARPDAALLRVPRGRAGRELAAESAVVRSGATGLSAAERQLVDAHREEAALALRTAAWFHLEARPPAGHKLRRRITAARVTPAASAHDVARAASEALRAGAADGSTSAGMPRAVRDLLESCVRDPGSADVSVGALCAAAHRLVPSVRARLIAAHAALWDGDIRTAWLLGRASVERASTPDVLAVALNNASEAVEVLGDLAGARSLCERASRTFPGLLAPLASRVYYAAMARDPRALQTAALELEAACAGDPHALDEQVDRFRVRSALGAPLLDRAQRDFARAQLDRLGSESRRVVDALL
jgi:hypothetical protein